MNNHITIIAGLPRCGSSLLMQMLNAAGFRCAGDYPGFEPDEIFESPEPEFVDSFIGGAMKLLDPHRVILPPGRSYRFIFLTRSRRQQAQSIVKFLQATGSAPGIITENGFERMKESLKVDQADGLKNITAHGCPILRIRFEDLIERRFITVTQIVRFLDFDHDEERFSAMLKVIRPRSAQCYGGLLELKLLAEMEADESLPPFDPLKCECNIPPYKTPCSYCESGNYNPEKSES